MGNCFDHISNKQHPKFNQEVQQLDKKIPSRVIDRVGLPKRSLTFEELSEEYKVQKRRRTNKDGQTKRRFP